MSPRLEKWLLYAGSAVAAFVVLPAVVLFLQGACGGSGPSAPVDGKTVSLLFTNNADDNIHLLAPGEVAGDANRLTPGDTRPHTTPPDYRPGDVIQIRASRSGVDPVNISRNCTVTRAIYDGAILAPAFDDSPVRIDCGSG